MTQKEKVNKICTIILTFIMAIGMLVPSMLVPKEVSADTRTSTLTRTRTITSFDYWAYGKSFLGDKWIKLNGNYVTSVFSASGFMEAYCMSPLMVTPSMGNKTVYSTGISSDDEKKMGAALYYIHNLSGASGDTAIFAAKYFVWHFLSNKPCYKGSIAYRLDRFDISRGDSKTVTKVYSDAMDYANRNYSKFTAETYCSDISTPNGQPIFCINYNFATGYAKLKKITKNNEHLTDLCPEQYSLGGAKYGVYSSSSLTGYQGSLTTNSSGNSNTIELNEGTYYVKETEAPKGYKLDNSVYTISVRAGETTVLDVSDEPLFDPLQLKIVKKSEEVPNSKLSLEGAEYTVKYYKNFLSKDEVGSAKAFRTWKFRTDSDGQIKFNDNYKIGGDELFKDENSRPVGLHGTYTFEETKEPKGFLRTEGIISLQHVKANSNESDVIEMKDVTDVEKIQKVNIKIKKKDSETGKEKPQGYGSFAGAKFNVYFYDPLQLMDILVGTIITNENGTGELVKLAPGIYMIEELEAPSGYNKNKDKIKIDAKIKGPNIACFDYLADVPEKPITINVRKTSFDEIGKVVYVEGAVLALFNDKNEKIEEWTSTKNGHTFKGLPKGKYYIKELRTPKGYLPLEKDYHFDVKETEELQKPKVFNEPIPEIKTVATFDTSVKEGMPEERVTVIDKFKYKKVMKGSPYAIKAKLVDKDNIDNVIAEDYKEFTPSNYSGEEKLEFTFDATKLENKRLVVLTELHRLDRTDKTLVAVHKDANNMDETVVIPTIKTKATDKIDAKKDMLAGKKQTIVDSVTYRNLIVGTKYRISGKLMDKQTGKPILDDGKEVTASREFIAETKNGKIELEFTLNSTALAGKTIVVFEDMYNDKIKIATHSEIDNEEQSIYIPKIGTKLTEKDSGEKEMHAFEDINLTDEIGYENLLVGAKYFLKGRVINKKTGETIAEAEREFSPEKESGSVNLDFALNAGELNGTSLVCFEEVYSTDDEGKPGKLVAEHKDVDDEGQTVRVVNPQIGTKASTDAGKKEILENKEITIVDRVSYRDLIVGKEYTIKGVLMDKSTSKPLIVDGKEVSKSLTFTAESKGGEKELVFKFDGSGLGNKTMVVFEEVYQERRLIGSHKDINDEGQSVRIIKKELTKTGDSSKTIFYILGLAMAAIAVIAMKCKKFRRA